MRVSEQGQVTTVCLVPLNSLASLMLLDENGTLIVSAYEKSTGSRNMITITNGKERLSSQEIIKMIKEAGNYRIEDDKFLKKAVVMNGLD
jgi:L1 cell adhesion molecule like protein